MIKSPCNDSKRCPKDCPTVCRDCAYCEPYQEYLKSIKHKRSGGKKTQ